MEVIGKAHIKNINTFLQWRQTEGKTWLQDNWEGYFKEKRNHELFSYAEKGYSRYGSYMNARPASLFDDKVVQHNEYLCDMHMAWELLYYDNFLAVIQSADFAFALPVSMVEMEEYENLDNYTIAALRGRTEEYTGPGLVPNQAISMRQMKSRMEEAERKIKKQQEKIKSLREEKEEELRRIREEIEKRYEEKVQTLQAKEKEMMATMERLKNELFLLDTEIYSIRCFLGEVIDFIPLVSGKHAPEQEPVVLYQKLRYLDEEMGKYLAIYNFDAGDTHLFEKALQHREDLQDIFAPGPKSVSLIRISRHSIQYGQHPEIANMLKAYETFHGKRIGILIRDGENIWMGWTDDDRISIHDENAFLEPKKGYEAIDDPEYKYGTASTKEEIASRYFVFSILQGMLKHGKTIHLPDEASLFQKNPYIIFSMADGWLEDNRFGLFADIVAITNKQPLKVGDMILTTMHITRDDAYNAKELYQPWNNNRGRGSRNRTYNASLSNIELYPVNCIDINEVYYICGKTYVVNKADEDYKNGTYQKDFRDSFLVTNNIYHDINVKGMTEGELFSFYLEEHKGVYYKPLYTVRHGEHDTYEVEIPDHIEKGETTYHYYLSAVKSEYGYETSFGRANMEIYENEYLNLTYLNSVYVLYAIQNRKVGGWEVGNSYLDYANSLPYLHKALEYLREREKEEAALLEKYMPLYPDWQVDLSNWRMKHQFHRLTDKRAKKFAALKSSP